MIQLGSDVRLRNGWTRMVVIEELTNGTIRAKYDNPEWPVGPLDFKQPQHASGTQLRNKSEFVLWDGIPGAYKKDESIDMTQRYRTLSTGSSHVTGVIQGKTTTGLLILEDEMTGHLHTVRPNEIEKIIQYTIKVRGMSNSSYSCHYTLPPDAPDLDVDDVLVSKTGNMYVITEIDTKSTRIKGMFRGKRMAVDVEFG